MVAIGGLGPAVSSSYLCLCMRWFSHVLALCWLYDSMASSSVRKAFRCFPHFFGCLVFRKIGLRYWTSVIFLPLLFFRWFVRLRFVVYSWFAYRGIASVFVVWSTWRYGSFILAVFWRFSRSSSVVFFHGCFEDANDESHGILTSQ